MTIRKVPHLAGMTIRGVVAVVGVLLAVACAPVDEREEQQNAPGATSRAASADAEYTPARDLTASQRLRQAIALLETGRPEAARSELSLYLKQRPGSELGRDLMAQITVPIERYFPADYREIVSEPGQSLSTIAQRYLGSAYKFHALARYNGISEPRRLGAGRTIRIPLTDEARAAFTAADAGEETVPVEEPAAMELDEAPGTADLSEDEAETPPAGDEMEMQPEVPDEPPEPSLSPEEIETLHRAALNAYRAQNLGRAIALWDQVLEADPDYENARIYRAQAIELQQRLDNLK